MSIRRFAAAAIVTATLVVGAATPAFARHGADDPAGHIRQEHHHGQVEVEHHHRGGHR